MIEAVVQSKNNCMIRQEKCQERIQIEERKQKE